MITRPSASMLGAQVSDLPGTLPTERVVGKKVSRIVITAAEAVKYAQTEHPSFRRTLYIPVSGVVFLTYSIDMSHRGISAGVNYNPPLNPTGDGLMPPGTYYPIGIGGQVAWRRSSSEAGLAGGFTYIADTIWGGQLSDRKHHYQTVGVAMVPFAVEGGYFYQFSLFLTAHTDAGSMSGVDGAAELTTGGGRNFLQLLYEPGMTVEA